MLASMYIGILDIIFFTAELRQIVIVRNDTNIFQFVRIKISQIKYLLIHKCLIKNNKQWIFCKNAFDKFYQMVKK